jgi:L-aminopeptidase/D-esterase-like protein
LPLPDGGWVAALVAVNAVGEIVDPATGRVVVAATPPAGDAPLSAPAVGQNTTIGVVATDRTLSKAQCLRVAQMAHDGLARAIRPSHTLYDGDTLFALSTGRGPAADPNLVGILAAEAVARAVLRAVGV